jgi:DNA recombination protein RmuC
VEFAIRLPGRDDSGSPIYLPIDAKFPQEDYHRLLDAADRADPDGVKEAGAALARAVRTSARDIAQKYIQPPETTDFAIMFLPTEGLYAEVLRQPGLVQEIGRQYGVMVAGPTTLAALLNSLRMGFRTLALQQRSGEIWRLLGAVKTEFTKFGDVLERLKKQLNTASRTIEESERRTRVMERKLEDVEELPPDLAREVVGLVREVSPGEGEEDDEEGEPA